MDPIMQSFWNTAVWDEFFKNFAIGNLPVGMVYFMTGYCIDKYKAHWNQAICGVGYLITVLCGAGVNLAVAFMLDQDRDVSSGLLSVWIFLSSALLFAYMLKKFEHYQPGKTAENCIRTLSECTFGIYLIHAIFIEQVCIHMGLQSGRLPYGLSVFVFSVFVFVISFAAVYCLRKIPIIGKKVL